MKKLIITALLVFPLLVVNAQQKVWSIKDCMDHAVVNNLQIQQQSLLEQDSELNIKDAKGAFLPNLALSASNTWNETQNESFRNSDYTIGTQVPIFNGFQNKNTLQSRKLEKIANDLTIAAAKDDIRINIATSYLQILLEKENLALLNNQLNITQQQIDLTQNLVEAGTTPQGDLLDLKAVFATDQQNIVDSENSVAIATINLKQLLNLSFETDFDVEDIEVSFQEVAILDKPINDLLTEVLGTRNEIKLAQENINIAEKQVEITKGNYLPTVSGFAQFASSQNGQFVQVSDNLRFSYGFSADIPIFNRFATKNAVSRNKVNSMRSKNELEQAKLRLTQNVYQTYLDAKAGKKSYEAAQTAVEAQQLAYEYAENRYEVGILNSLEFSQAKLRLQNSQTQLIQAKYNFLFQLKLLELYYQPKP